MRVRFSTDARRDRREAQAYYRGASPAASRSFVRDLESAIHFLLEYPLGAPIRQFDVRAKTLAHFPYTILYRVIGDRVFVLAIAHQSRDPEYYSDRLS